MSSSDVANSALPAGKPFILLETDVCVAMTKGGALCAINALQTHSVE